MTTRFTSTPTLCIVKAAAIACVLSALPTTRALAAGAVAPNAVSEWSQTAQDTITAGRSPASSEYLLALVHAAIYDAVVAVEGRYQPFRVRVEADKGASVDAAVAAAAFHVLRARVPAAEVALTNTYLAYVAALPEGSARNAGLAVGAEVASRWLALRADDRFDASVPYEQPAVGPGVWEPTAPTPPVDTKLALVKPYVLRSPDRFRPSGPRRLKSRAYAKAFDEVYAIGRIDSLVRTPEQLDVARFWAEHTATQWNRNLRHIAAGAHLDLVDTARVLAMAHVVSADALVGCFDAKYAFTAWRPVQAIQRADTDGNDATTVDPSWTPLLNVNHPEYPSAHACWTSAVTSTLGYVFRSDYVTLGLDSQTTGSARQYERLSDVTREVADARIAAGLHFRFSTDDGALIGQRVARYVTRRHFRPILPR